MRGGIGTVVVRCGDWEMIVTQEVANNPAELAKIRATLKMISEIEVVDGL